MELLEAFDKTLGEDGVFEIDAYPDDVSDDEWMPLVGKRNPTPFVLTFEIPSMRNKVARKLLRDYGCNFIRFKGGWGDLPWPVLAWKLIKSWPDIREKAKKAKPLSLIDVTYRDGKPILEYL